MRKLPVPSPLWKQYVQQGKLIESELSPLIVDSWKRSTMQNINPYRIMTNDLLERQSLLDRMESCRQLLEVASPIMFELYNIVKGSGFAVLLTDNQGYILKIIADPGFEEKARKIWLTVGANWHESVKGTNAIGTALVNRCVVNVFAWEHYCRENHFLSCSAAPIFDPQGELLGVLDISSDYHNNDPYILSSVVTAVKAIESRLLLANTQKQLALTCQQLSSLMDAVPEGLLAIDREGCITRINQTCSTLLGVSPKDCIGQPLENIFSNADQWLSDLKRGKGALERTVTMETSLGTPQTYLVRMTSEHCQNLNGALYGAIASIRKLSTKTLSSTPARVEPTPYFLQDIICDSSQMLEAKRLSSIAARNHSTVLLQGESGTGKEMFAQAIHNASARASGPFIPINCGAIPENLLESELFGYEEGAFTGAKKGGQIGKFELAQGGTIFLDEIGEMPLHFQVALLRVLQDKRVVRIGGSTPIPLDVRIIAATNKNLDWEVKQGNFRLDLYYRINILTIEIPPLRERGEDILSLANHFLDKLNPQLEKNITTLSPDLKEWFLNYDWPGNVRELENIIERAVNLTESDTIGLEHLPASLRKDLFISSPYFDTPRLTLKNREIQAIRDALSKTGGNITQSAKILGIGRNTLHRKIKELNL